MGIDFSHLFVVLSGYLAGMLFLTWAWQILIDDCSPGYALVFPLVVLFLAYYSNNLAIETEFRPIYGRAAGIVPFNYFMTSAIFVFYFLAAAIFVIEKMRARVKGPRPPKRPWQFYLDDSGLLCLKGAFTYTFADPKGGRQRVKVRTFNGTADEFLRFNAQWAPCERQREYALAVDKKRRDLYEGQFREPKSLYDDFRDTVGL